MMLKLRKLWLIVSCALLLASCELSTGGSDASDTAYAYNNSVATAWFDLVINLGKESAGFSPPVVARALGYTGITLYESVVAGMPNNYSLSGQLSGLSNLPAASGQYHWGVVANSALASITRSLFGRATSDQLTRINDLEQSFNTQYKTDLAVEVYSRSVSYGQAVASSIFQWSMTDGGHEGYLSNTRSDYVMPTGVDKWQPTPPAFATALQPYWGNNRPFATKIGTECEPSAPYAYSETVGTPFYNDAKDVYNTVKNLSAEQRQIALYWSDDAGKTYTPPGHSISILTQLLRANSASLGFAAQAYAELGIGVSDAFIGCWHAKYQYNVLRPITYIQRVIDSSFNANDMPLITPPFPEYTSGHSVQIGATVILLNSLFGSSTRFTDNTQSFLGYVGRSFNSFNEMAQEAAVSRVYGGIHYAKAVDEGLVQGQCIGNKVLQLRWTQ
jgi:hypothetical protein